MALCGSETTNKVSFSTVSPKMLRKGFVAKAQTAHSTM